jgi:hypothetical protein
MTARGMLYTSESTVPLSGATTTASLDLTAADGGGACLAHAVLSATAGGCGLDVELGVGEAPYGGVRSVVLTVGPACAGFTAAKEGVYLSPPGWAPGWWLGPTAFDAGVSCVPGAELRFPDRILRLARADGAHVDVDLRDVVFTGDLAIAPSTSPFFQCLTLACAPGMRDGGAGWCAPSGTCAKGFHDGGGGACVLEGTCARGYGLDASGTCVAWAPAGTMVQARYSAVAFRLPDGDVLVTGGYTPGSGPHDPIRSERYRPATRAWAKTGTPLYKHEEAAYAQLADGRVLATGGFDTYRGGVYDPGGTSVAEVYDPATGEWAPVAPMNAGRYHHVAVTLKDGRVLVVGGENLASAEFYDPAANTWTATGDMAVARTGHGAIILPDGRVLVAGWTTAEVWDPATWQFTSAPGPWGWVYSPRFTPLADGRLIMRDDMYGWTNVLDPRTMRLYWFASGSWDRVAPLGGSLVLAVRGDSAAVVDVDAIATTPVPSPPRTYGSGTATVLLDGTVLFAGGGTTYDAADLYVGRW